VAAFLKMGQPPQAPDLLQRRGALGTFLAGILRLDQPDQPFRRQGSIDHVEIARLEDIERPMREGQQQGAAQGKERHLARQVGGLGGTLAHGLPVQENRAVESRRRPLSVAGSLGPQASNNSSSFLRAPSSSQARSRLMMATSASAASSRLPSALRTMARSKRAW